MFNSSIKYQKHTRLGNCDSEIKQQKPMVCFDCNFCSFFLSLAALSLCTQVMQFRRWNRFLNTESTGAQQRHAQVSPPQQEIGTVWKARREKTRYVWWGGGVPGVMTWCGHSELGELLLRWLPSFPSPGPPIPSLSVAPQRMAPPPLALPLRLPHQCGSSGGRGDELVREQIQLHMVTFCFKSEVWPLL